MSLSTIIYLFLILLCGCSSQNYQRHSFAQTNAMEEMRIALMDLRQAYGEQKIEIQLLEDQIAKQAPASKSSSGILNAKVEQLEKMQDHFRKDLKELSSHAKKTSETLNQYGGALNHLEREVKAQYERLSEIAKLKGTLTSISKAIQAPTSDNIYIVRSGDSLEKIARKYSTNVDALKKLNGLTTNTIMIGQELKIPR